MSHPVFDPKRPYIFIHIPKTAGSTLQSILNRNYASPEILNVRADSNENRSSLDKEVLKKYSVIKGHFSFRISDEIGINNNFMTVLRQPYARVLSQYYFIKSRPNHALNKHIKEGKTIYDFLDLGLRKNLDNGMVRQIAGVPEKEFGTIDQNDLQTAKEHLDKHFFWIGITEDFNRSLVLLRTLSGLKRPYYRSKKKQKGRPTFDQQDSKTQDIISQYSKFDLELYRHGQQRLNEDCDREGQPLQQALKKFERRNKWVDLF